MTTIAPILKPRRVDTRRVRETASQSLDLHLANGFTAWTRGDDLGRHIARRGAQRCCHVLRLLEVQR